MQNNSWLIIKTYFTKDSTEGSFGYLRQLNNASDLFIQLTHNSLVDKEESIKCFNEDKEVMDAILARRGLDELKDAGVIS